MLGFLLLLLVLFAGHFLRTHLLAGPDGHWRSELETLPWSVDLQDSAEYSGTAKPKLVVPLAINNAPLDSLVLLPRVGPVLAKRIIAARNAGQNFASPADLMAVKGIGPHLAALLDTLLTY